MPQPPLQVKARKCASDVPRRIIISSNLSSSRWPIGRSVHLRPEPEPLSWERSWDLFGQCCKPTGIRQDAVSRCQEQFRQTLDHSVCPMARRSARKAA